MRVPGGINCLLQSRRGARNEYNEYKRKTPANEYAIRAFYENDYTESRLHPATVLTRVDVRIDRPRPVADLFSDLVEIQELCKDGCRIVGLGRYQDNSKFALFPKNPKDEQRAWALRVTSSLLPGYQPANPVPVIYFYWERQKGEYIYFDNGSLDWPIVRAEFTVADISFPHDSHEPGFTDLGEFRP
jgi:hypothetical protein